jgi:threonine aldolase
MNVYSFKNDYSEGCHPDLLNALSQNNSSQEIGYGEDSYSLEAIKLIQQKCGNDDLAVHLVSGGTQANLIVIAAALRPYESVISAASGHIHVHETGAIEATGHKIQTVISKDGKLHPRDVQSILDKFEDEHTVKPRLVYISNSTEIGSIYNKKELIELSIYCKSNSLLLFLDGARLGSALTSTSNDLSLTDIANFTDVFYIGGTKNGALFGEAIVIKNEELKSHFRFHLKQRGALLAKGRALGVQFHELFKNDLFFELARHANRMAAKLTAAIHAQGYSFLTDPVSNQIFPILPDILIQKLSRSFDFYTWQKVDEDHSAIRLVTSWATEEEAVDAFIKQIVSRVK